MRQEITTELLKTTFAEKRIIRDGRQPSNTDLIFLAGELEFLRHCHVYGAAVAGDARMKLQASLIAALGALPTVLDGAEKMMAINRDYGWDDTHVAQEHAKLQRLKDAILAFEPPPPHPDVLPLMVDYQTWQPICIETKMAPDATTWHNFAHRLASDFQAALQKANPGKEIGLTPIGPVSRYLAAVIPLVSGETPRGDAAIKYLRDEMGRGNKCCLGVIP